MHTSQPARASDQFTFPALLATAAGIFSSMTLIIAFAGTTDRNHALDAQNWPFFITASLMSGACATAISVAAQYRPPAQASKCAHKIARSLIIGTAAATFCVCSVTAPVLLLLAGEKASFDQKSLMIVAPLFSFFTGAWISALASVNSSNSSNSSVHHHPS